MKYLITLIILYMLYKCYKQKQNKFYIHKLIYYKSIKLNNVIVFSCQPLYYCFSIHSIYYTANIDVIKNQWHSHFHVGVGNTIRMPVNLTQILYKCTI